MYRVYDRRAHGYVGTMTGGRYRRIVPADRAYHYQRLSSIKNSLGRYEENPKAFTNGVRNRHQPFSHKILDTSVYRIEQLVDSTWQVIE